LSEKKIAEEVTSFIGLISQNLKCQLGNEAKLIAETCMRSLKFINREYLSDNAEINSSKHMAIQIDDQAWGQVVPSPIMIELAK